MIKYSLVILSFFVFISENFSQHTRYWVQFTDKNNSPFSVSNPSAFLSSRALQRRVNQNIPVNIQDIPVNPAYLDSITSKGGIIINKSKWLNGAVVRITNPSSVTAIQNLPFVSSVNGIASFAPVENDVNRSESKFETPGPLPETFIDVVSSTAYNYGMSFNQATMIGADCLHNLGFSGEGMLITVIDAGFYAADTLSVFDSLRANGQIIATYDFVENNPNVYGWHSHGTSVLSTIGGNIPGSLVGTAPKANFILLRSEEGATEYIIEEYNWAAAAEFADSCGTDVINTSLGYTTFDDPSQNHSYAQLNGDIAPISIAHDIAAAKGILVVCSAGNSGPSTIGAPADADSALTVGAVNAGGNIASFSSHGPASDGAVKPNVVAQGEQTIVVYSSGFIAGGNGTSFSSPVMAGAVACLWQANPTLTNMQIINAVQQSASQYSSPDSLYGYGIPNMCTANQLLNGISPDLFSENIISGPHPNPFSSQIEFSIYSEKRQLAIIEILDPMGKKILTETRMLSPFSHNTFGITSPENLANGIYFFSVKLEESTFVKADEILNQNRTPITTMSSV